MFQLLTGNKTDGTFMSSERIRYLDAPIDIGLEDRIAEAYSDLSAKLKDAANYVVAHQMDVAARSLRAVSADSGVSPATLSRLARTLGFESYEAMREVCRHAVAGRGSSLSERAAQLKDAADSNQHVLDRQAQACVVNITEMTARLDRARLQQAVDALQAARQVVLFGAFGSTGITEYLAYLANYFSSNWTLAGRMGASLGSALTDTGKEDVLFIITKSPYARRAVHAAEIAKSAGTQTIVLTDSHTCPALRYADFSFIVPTETPQFLSSYVATLALIETMIAMLVAQSEGDPSQRIRDVESNNKRLGEFWSD